MSRPLIITIGIVFILIVLGLWVYLMLFGAPESPREVFTNFGFEPTTQETTITPPANIPLPETTIDTTGEALRQLTTRPVAGFTFMTSSSTETVRYVERGTGHVYEINLETGEESSLSRTTVPQTTNATFSEDGNTIAFTAHDNYTTNVFVGTLQAEINVAGIQLQPGAQNLSFSSETDVLYTVSSNGTTIGYRHNINSLNRTELFSFNYNSLDVAWGSGLEKIYLATKPAHNLEGYVYSTENNILTPEIPPAYGLSALFSNSYIVTTYNASGQYVSNAWSESDEVFELPILALKEKCTFDSFTDEYLWCAAPNTAEEATFAEDWYKGTLTSEDNLWLVELAAGEARLYADFKNLSGRIIDVSEIKINETGTAITFTNKTDHTLWLYDLTVE